MLDLNWFNLCSVTTSSDCLALMCCFAPLTLFEEIAGDSILCLQILRFMTMLRMSYVHALLKHFLLSFSHGFGLVKVTDYVCSIGEEHVFDLLRRDLVN